MAAAETLDKRPGGRHRPHHDHRLLALSGGQAVDMLKPARFHVAHEIWLHDGKLAHGADRAALELAIGVAQDAHLLLDFCSYDGLFALSVARYNPAIRSIVFEFVPDNFLLL